MQEINKKKNRTSKPKAKAKAIPVGPAYYQGLQQKMQYICIIWRRANFK